MQKWAGTGAAAALCGLILTSCGSDSIDWEDAKDHVGETVEVCGPVRSVRHDRSAAGEDMSFINIGVDYPDPDRFTFVLPDQDLGNYEGNGDELCGEGEIHLYEGVPQIKTKFVTNQDAPPP